MAERASRLTKKFAALEGEGRAGFVAYVMAGDPDFATSLEILHGLPDAGADIIELGVPFTDPMADGPAIQAAGQRALKAGAGLAQTLELAAAFRKSDADTPLVLMGYYNPIYARGPARFVSEAKAAGVDGLIVVDLPPEEDAELTAPARAGGLDFIRLATPTSDAARLPKVVAGASGFVYYVSVAGVTGAESGQTETIARDAARIGKASNLPVAVGFGIKTPGRAAEIAKCADAVVVGSALVERIAQNLDEKGEAGPKCVNAVLSFAGDLGRAIRRARG